MCNFDCTKPTAQEPRVLNLCLALLAGRLGEAVCNAMLSALKTQAEIWKSAYISSIPFAIYQLLMILQSNFCNKKTSRALFFKAFLTAPVKVLCPFSSAIKYSIWLYKLQLSNCVGDGREYMQSSSPCLFILQSRGVKHWTHMEK